MLPWCRSNACKTQHKHWVETIPWHHLWYPGVAQMCVKHNTNIELRQELGLTHGTLVHSNACKTQCKHWVETTKALSWDNPSASLTVPWAHSNACKTQYKHWVETMPRPHWWYPELAQMRAKHNANNEIRQHLGLTYGTQILLDCV